MKILFYLFSHIRSFQGLFYHYELNANGFYLLLYIKTSRDVYQKVYFGNNTYSGILTDFYHSFFLGVVLTMNNMQLKRQCNKRNITDSLLLGMLVFSDYTKLTSVIFQ